MTAFLGLILFSFVDLWAKPVTKGQAGKTVRGWLKADGRPLGITLGRQIEEVETFLDGNGQAIYYIVYLQPSGFVIVPADNLVEPIVGFVEIGRYNPSDDNPLGALVSRDMPGRIAAARSLQAAAGSAQQTSLQAVSLKARDKWTRLQDYADGLVETLGIPSISDVRVAPLLQSTWSQKTVGDITGGISCYNYYTPPYENGNSANYYTGCVATAMAQFMRYHEHPAAGVGTPSFTITVDAVPQSRSLRGGNGSGGPYAWSDMVLQPDSSITEPQRQAIGALCHDAGVSISMAYTSSGSSASLYDGTKRLRDGTFDYSNAIYGWNSNSNIGPGLNAMVNPNLDANYPVALSLTGPGSGHAVVCDGYGYNTTTLYHHLNMGWSGTDNAWYNLPNIVAYKTYNTVDGCTYNVFISGSGEIISGRVTDQAGNPISDVNITATATAAYYATTNERGIYALLNVPSNTGYIVTAGKPLHAFIPQNVSTGNSADMASTSGNLWRVDFVSQSATPPTAYSETVSALSGTTKTITLNATDEGYPDPPAQITYIITSLTNHGRLTDPAAGRITSTPYTIANNGNIVDYWPCTYYTGQDYIGFKANDGGTAPVGGDSLPAAITIDVNNVIHTTFEPSSSSYADWPLYTSCHDSRTQVIYLAGEMGEAKTITDLALDIYQAPGQTLNNWTIRMKHTTLTGYVGWPEFETTGWTMVFQGNESPTPIGWRYFSFQIPFEYNGTSNLMIDFSHNNTSSSSNGPCMVSNMSGTRVMLSFCNSTHGDPLNWTSYTAPAVYTATAVPNLKLISRISAEPITGDFEPDCEVDLEDLTIFMHQWLRRELSADVAPQGGDNIVNFLDWAVFANSYKGVEDMDDLADFIQQWLGLNAYCADIAPAAGGDGVVDMRDFAVLAENWLERLE